MSEVQIPWNKGLKTGIHTSGFSGRNHTDSSKEKTSKSLLKKNSQKGYVHPNTGRIQTDEEKYKRSKSVKKYWNEHDRSIEQPSWNIGLTKKDSEKMKGIGEKVSTSVLSNMQDRKRRSDWMQLYNLTQKIYFYSWNHGMHPWEWMKISKEDFYQKLTISQQRRPNGLEISFISLIEKYNLPFRYVGNGAIWICGKNPDFIHTENKIVLELFGDYWHKNEDEAIRTEHFKSHGFNTIVIWESEIKNQSEEYIINFIMEKLI